MSDLEHIEARRVVRCTSFCKKHSDCRLDDSSMGGLGLFHLPPASRVHPRSVPEPEAPPTEMTPASAAHSRSSVSTPPARGVVEGAAGSLTEVDRRIDSAHQASARGDLLPALILAKDAARDLNTMASSGLLDRARADAFHARVESLLSQEPLWRGLASAGGHGNALMNALSQIIPRVSANDPGKQASIAALYGAIQPVIRERFLNAATFSSAFGVATQGAIRNLAQACGAEGPETTASRRLTQRAQQSVNTLCAVRRPEAPLSRPPKRRKPFVPQRSPLF